MDLTLAAESIQRKTSRVSECGYILIHTSKCGILSIKIIIGMVKAWRQYIQQSLYTAIEIIIITPLYSLRLGST